MPELRSSAHAAQLLPRSFSEKATDSPPRLLLVATLSTNRKNREPCGFSCIISPSCSEGTALFCSQGLHLLTLEICLLSFVPPLLVENIFLQLYVYRHHKFWGEAWGLLGAWKHGKQQGPKIGWCLSCWAGESWVYGFL